MRNNRALTAPYFFKQYGARRTGTNLLRLLISTYVRNAAVLMHVLGDKHSPPVDLADGWSQSQHSVNPEITFARRATLSAPAETTDLSRPEQAAYLASIAPALATAFQEGGLGFLISVKDPYGWAASIGRYRGWLPSAPYNFAEDRKAAKLMRAECVQLNLCCRAWLEHYRNFESRSLIIRFEDLMDHPAEAVRNVCAKFGLPAPEVEVALPARIVIPAPWDEAEMRLHGVRFDADIRRESYYLGRLTERLRDVVASHIEWPLMASLGYHPRTFGATR